MATTPNPVPIPQSNPRTTPAPPVPRPQPQYHSQSSRMYPPAANAPTEDGVDADSAPRPNDARTIHLILASLGVSGYQERVPLQLLDFAYRYTAGILGDAAHLAAEGYTGNETSNTSGGRGKKQTNDGDVTLAALKLATSSRLGYQFSSTMPKQSLLEIAEERNRMRLPDVSKTKVFGVRLPEERFLLTGRSWDILEDTIGDEKEHSAKEENDELMDDTVDGKPGKDDDDEDEDDKEGDGFDDVFGEDGEAHGQDNGEDADDDDMDEG